MNRTFYTSFTAILCYILIDAFFMPWVYPGVIIPFFDPRVGFSGFQIPAMGVKAEGDSEWLVYFVYLYPLSAALILLLGAFQSAVSKKLSNFIMLLPLIVTLFFLVRTLSLGSAGDFAVAVTSFGTGMYHTMGASVVLFVIGTRQLLRKKEEKFIY